MSAQNAIYDPNNMSPLEYAMNMQDIRSQICPVWKDIYEENEYCEKIKSYDIERHKQHISQFEDELKKQEEEEKKRKKFNALTNEERDTLQEVKNEIKKGRILRSYNLN